MPDSQPPELPVTLADIQAAAKVLEGNIERTELAHSRTLSAITGAEVWIKLENRQYTAAFKERGALNKLAKLTDDEKKSRRHRGLGRQPCAGRCLPCPPPRHPGDHRDGR